MTVAAVEVSDQGLYREARQELLAPKRSSGASAIFVVLFLLFLASQFDELMTVWGLVALVVVVTFHEAGHALGMRLFGFRDVRMFFIPFFGAAVSGRARGAAAWKEALVSLLGPLPGIILGVVGIGVMQRHPTPLVISMVQSLIFINAFNLLPFGLLDGGRFLGRVLFSRHRVLDVGFQAIGSALLVAFALTGSLYVLAAFAAAGLLTLPQHWRVCGAAASLRKQYPSLVADPEKLPESEARAVFDAARGALGESARDQPKTVAGVMDAILEATKPAPGVLASAGLLFLYCAGLALGVVAFAQVTEETGSAEWASFEQPEWRAEFPRVPRLHVIEKEGDGIELYWRAVVQGSERFGVTAIVGGRVMENDPWRDEACETLARETGTTLADARRVELGAIPAGECSLFSPDRVVRARTIVANGAANGARYQVVASAPSWGENQSRFFDSFELLPGTSELLH